MESSRSSPTLNPSPRALRAPTGGQPVGKTRMARAVREARDRLIAAEAEAGLARIAERPAAVAAGKLEQRAALRALDRPVRASLVARPRPPSSVRASRAASARSASARRACSASPSASASPARPAAAVGRKPEAVDLADDGVARNADLGGDLAAGQPRGDVALELLHALRASRLLRCSCMALPESEVPLSLLV